VARVRLRSFDGLLACKFIRHSVLLIYPLLILILPPGEVIL
jgi:hypothetical protein